MADAFIKLHRKLLDWEWYDDPNTFRLFIHCLLKANWKVANWHGIEIQPGQFVTSLATLAEETQLSVHQVRVALNHLIMTKELTNKSHSKFRIITVNNWSLYQVCDKQVANKWQSNDKQVATIEEYKEEKEIKNKYIFVPPTVEEVRAYCQERNNSVDPLTFVNFYSSKGWMIGKNKMKDWKSAVRTWEQKDKEKAKNDKPKFDNYNQREYDYTALLKDIT